MNYGMPPELIPAPEMTVAQYKAWYKMAERHPRITWNNLQYNVAPGDTIVAIFKQWCKTYTIDIIGDDIWDGFDDLRVSWETNCPASI